MAVGSRITRERTGYGLKRVRDDATSASLVSDALPLVLRATGAAQAACVRCTRDIVSVLSQTGPPPPAVLQHLRRIGVREGCYVVKGYPIALSPIGDRLALLALRDQSAAEFTAADLATLRTVGTVIRGEEGQADRALSALYEVATRLLASLDLDEVLLLVSDAASRLLASEIAGIFLLDERTGELVMRHAIGNRTVRTARLRVRSGQGLAGRVLETGEAHRVDDYTADTTISKEFLEVAGAEGTQSALCVPMKVLGQTIGTLSVWRRRASVFTDAEVRLLSGLAHLATMAVHNAHLYEAEHTATSRLLEANKELEERYRATEQSLRIHRQLTAIAVNGNEVAEVVHALESLTGGAVVLLGDEARTLAPVKEETQRVLADKLLPWLTEHAGTVPAPSTVLQIDQALSWVVIAPIRASGIEFGNLALALSESPTHPHVAAAEQGAIVCALLLARRRAAISAASRLQSEFVWDLLEGRIPDAAEAVVRARHLGHGFQLPARVILVRVSGLQDLATRQRWPAERLERSRSLIGTTLLRRAEARCGAGVVLARRADLFAAVVPQLGQATSTGSARSLARALAEPTDVEGIQQEIGVSGMVDSVSALPNAFRQAQFALSACSSPRQPFSVFDDLGVVQFLLAPARREDLQRFAEDTLGQLLEYDRKHDARLVQSLRSYLEADCNLKRAAAALYVHHKTMAYRFQRIQDLTGLALDRQEDRFRAQLALKILSLGNGGKDGGSYLESPAEGLSVSG
jgi:sugar diacid utilization regulator/putative methionine-R-sulfoxide reductase with GAF domain